MTQEALKLAEIIEHFDSNDESLPLELLKEISATLRALALQALHDENERLGLYKDAYAEQEPVAWRELCRRLYVELFHCDQQMMATRDEEGYPMWQQGATVRDVLADAKTALETPPPQPQQEHVVCCQQYDTCLQPCTPRGEHLAQRTEQEPVADDFFRMIADRNPKPFPSPQRTWVGIEGEEIRKLWEEVTKPNRSTMTMVTAYARALEAYLKQKNGYAEEKKT